MKNCYTIFLRKNQACLLNSSDSKQTTKHQFVVKSNTIKLLFISLMLFAFMGNGWGQCVTTGVSGTACSGAGGTTISTITNVGTVALNQWQTQSATTVSSTLTWIFSNVPAGTTIQLATCTGNDTEMTITGPAGFTTAQVDADADVNLGLGCTPGSNDESASITCNVTGEYRVRLSRHNNLSSCVNYGGTATTRYLYWRVTCAPCTPPAVVGFGSNTWNVLGYTHATYNFANLASLAGETFKGYYTDATVDINSELRWGSTVSPSSASSYTGCAVTYDNHTVVYKRQGFPTEFYKIDLNNHDDGVQCYVNGTLVYSLDGCCADRGVIWQGVLCSTSTVEFRVMEGGGGSLLNVDFIESTWNVNAGPDLSVCSGTPSTLTGASNTQSNVSFNATPNIAIPDVATTSTTLTVSGSALNANQIVGVLINAAHTWDSDLSFTLTAPNGSSIDLSSNNGGSGVNYTNTYFSTTGASITTGVAPFTGTYTPEVAFSNLTGTANGTWTLTINDNAGGDVGTLYNWGITVSSINVGSYAWTSSPAGFTSTLLTPTVSPTVTTTYTLTASANGCSLSDAAIVNVTSPVGNPAVFGNNTWNVYVYNGNNRDNLAAVSYYGYYTQSGVNATNYGVNTQALWNVNGAPSSAAGYQGCVVGPDYHTVVHKRQGFPCGLYQLTMQNWDDETIVYINGTAVWSSPSWDGGCNPCNSSIGTYYLGATSTIEIRTAEGAGGSNCAMDIISTGSALNGGAIAGVTNGLTICSGIDPGAFTNSTSPSGGTIGVTNGSPAATIYAWELSTTSATAGFAAIAGQTGLTFDPTTLTTTSWFRRKTTDACGTVYSNVIQVVVNPNPTVTASASATTICEGQSVTLNGGGASTYSWNNGATNNVPTFPTSTTTYTVTGTAANTCTSTANVTVNVNNTADFANLQSPQNATVNCGSNTTVYGKIYDAALTPAAGANGTISVQVGVSTTNTDPSTWAAGAWTIATFNQQYLNDDEYMASIGSTLAPGTYYYAFRYQIGSTGCYRYGGYSASNGGFWNGTTNVNGTLTVNGSTIDWANIQFPTSGTVCQGSNYTVYGQVYEAGVTDPTGAASGLIAEIGVSYTDTDPSTWAAGSWSSASFNTQSGNNDEFVASIGSALTPGTYYYAFRYKLASTCNYQYGGTNGFYNGTSNMNGVLVVTASPAATLTTASSTICNGNEVTLSGSVTATGAWTLNLSNGQTATGTGNGSWSLTTIPTATTTYSISSLTTSGCAANLSGTSTITVPTGTALSGNNESATCMVNQSGWIHFYTSGASPKLIASINSQGQNLGNVTVTSYVDPSSALVPACSNPSAMYATNVLQRHWVITPTTQPTAPVLIRLPHTNAEYTTLSGVASTNQNQNDNIIVPQDLDLTKYSNSLTPGLVDDNALNNCGSGTSSFHQQTNYGYTNTYSGVNENYAEFSIPGFSEFWLHGSAQSSPLPVELVNFQANCAGDGIVNVTWATASEHNSANFTVEKSRDGINWTVVSSVAGAGNSNQMINYSIADNNAAAGVNYYRLTQTDFDGASETFNIASVICGDNSLLSTLKVYPNPSAGDFYIDFTSEEITGSSVITITDARGMEVYNMNVTIEKGNNVFHIDNMEAAPGMYYIQVSNGTNTSNIVKHSLR